MEPIDHQRVTECCLFWPTVAAGPVARLDCRLTREVGSGPTPVAFSSWVETGGLVPESSVGSACSNGLSAKAFALISVRLVSL